MIQNIFLQINPGGDFNEYRPFRAKLKNRPFRDEMHFLPFPAGYLAVKGNLRHLPDELFLRSFLDDPHLATGKIDFQTTGSKGRAKEDVSGVLGDIDEPTATGAAIAKLGGINVTGSIHFSRPHEGEGNSGTVVEIHLHRMFDQGIGVVGDAKIDTAFGNTTVQARFDRHQNVVRDALFCSDSSNHVVGDTGAEVDCRAGNQFHHRAPSDHLAHIHRQRLDRCFRNHQVATKRRLKEETARLAVIVFRVVTKHNGIDKIAGDNHGFRMQGAGFGLTLDLGNDLATVALCCQH